ncbi:hypothetical protein Tco_0778997, partial [Tanacetum coccineum]
TSNVVVAADSSGDYKTVVFVVAAASKKSKTRKEDLGGGWVKSDKEVVDLIDADIEDGNIVNILNCAERIICLSQKSSPSYPGTRATIENVHVPDGNQDYLHNLCESHFAILE